MLVKVDFFFSKKPNRYLPTINKNWIHILFAFQQYLKIWRIKYQIFFFSFNFRFMIAFFHNLLVYPWTWIRIFTLSEFSHLFQVHSRRIFSFKLVQYFFSPLSNNLSFPFANDMLSEFDTSHVLRYCAAGETTIVYYLPETSCRFPHCIPLANTLKR